MYLTQGSHTFVLFCVQQDGVWIRGLHLEGAGWDKKNACLVEANPMQLVCRIPTIHFKPVENKKKSGKGNLVIPFFIYHKEKHEVMHAARLFIITQD